MQTSGKATTSRTKTLAVSCRRDALAGLIIVCPQDSFLRGKAN